MPAFRVVRSNIPDKGTLRSAYNTRERLDSLMRRPPHKSGTTKFDPLSSERTIAPLTSEDVNQFCNLGLMNSLR